jgi:hypothetical protein
MQPDRIREQGINNIEIIPSSMEGKIICLQSMVKNYMKYHRIDILYYKRFKRGRPVSILCRYLKFPKLTIGVSKLKRFRWERRSKNESFENDDYYRSILNCFRRLG